MLQNALIAPVRVSVATYAGVTQLLVDNTLGRVLDTNPDKVR